MQDSVAGTISATYGADGEILTQLLPGGVQLKVGYDANRNPVRRVYSRISDGAEISTSAVVENSSGQWVTHTTSSGTKNYVYDRLGRLTDVRETIVGLSSCTARQYEYNVRAGRTALRSAVSSMPTCVDPRNPGTTPVSTTTYGYDSADRLVSESGVAAGAWVYDPLGRITSAPVRSTGVQVVNAYYANDLIASQTIEGLERQTWTLDALGRFNQYKNEAWLNGAWQEAVTKVNHYDSDSDSPAWIAEDVSLPDEVTRYVDGLDGNLAVQTGKSGARVLQLVDLHGDIMTTLPIRDGESTADWAALKHQTSDEFGNPTDLAPGGRVVSDGSAPGKDGRYGWLGGKQRSADALGGVILMGVRLYDPATGRFWSVDPVPGGNATAYDYCAGDPVNCTDLDGNWGFFKKLVKKVAKKVAKVAELASNIPGPIGAASAAISAGAYAATGNRAKALEMTVSAAAAMVPGGRAAVKAGFAVARASGKVAARVGRSVVKAVRRGCGSSFVPGTAVLMADGTTRPIDQIQVGDMVLASDTATGEVTAQPVINTIVSQGDKHLVRVTTARGPPAPVATTAGETSWTATANHPVWVVGRGWTNAEDLEVGDVTLTAANEPRVVSVVADLGWSHDQRVHNLTVANAHTYVVGGSGAGTLVHNSSCAINRGVYVVKDRVTGKPYVGMSVNIDRRLARHVRSGKITSSAAAAAQRTAVQGRKRIDLRVAEQREMQRRGGLAATANRRNEIARRNWAKHGIR